jgi:murein DD-endopeptidase MepM/ murein hydrolase activator NlpD
VQDPSLIGPLNQISTDTRTGSGNRLEGKVHAAQGLSGEKQRNELKKVSQEFESVFIAYMLKVMRETIDESGLLEEGFGKSIYTELFDQEVSRSMAQRGALGIGDLLYRNLTAAKTVDDFQSAVPPADVPASGPQQPSQASPTDSENSNRNEGEISDLQLPLLAPVSSAFGLRQDPISHQVKLHKGLDLAAPEGMKVIAALPGTVVSAGYEKGFGNTVLIQHAGGLQTRYGHLGSISVKAGEIVSEQKTLGTIGNTGHSTGPHLHFEVIRMGKPVNPLLELRSQLAALEPISDKLKLGS